MRFNYILASLIFYISLSAAWPWPANLVLGDASRQLARRQDDNKPASSSAAPASKADSNTASQTITATESSKSDSKPTDKPSDNNNNDNNNNKNQTSSAKSSSISITQAEAGGVSMIQPPATSTTYYKVGDNITWIWNYTSLVSTPNAVNVVVSCASLGATYTIRTNMSVDATATVTWDTSKETGQPSPGTNKYTLAIYDAGDAAGPTQVVSPGKLGSWSQFTFGMYTKQPYTDGAGYQCVTCNAAVAIAERQAFGVIFTVVAITVVSFTWFTSGFLSL